MPGHVVAATAAAEPKAPATFCRKRFAGYKVPRRIELVEALPRNPMGKVQKFKIVERLTG